MERELEDGFIPGAPSFQEPLADFDEPVFRRVRTRRGFFGL